MKMTAPLGGQALPPDLQQLLLRQMLASGMQGRAAPAPTPFAGSAWGGLPSSAQQFGQFGAGGLLSGLQPLPASSATPMSGGPPMPPQRPLELAGEPFPGAGSLPGGAMAYAPGGGPSLTPPPMSGGLLDMPPGPNPDQGAMLDIARGGAGVPTPMPPPDPGAGGLLDLLRARGMGGLSFFGA